MDNDEDFLKTQEDGLKSDYQELRTQIEENEIIHGIPSKGMSSIYIPKDPEYFRRRRKIVIQRTLQVSSPRDLVIQADQMVADQNTCLKGEFNATTLLPLLLQYFLDKMSEIVNAKHLLMLRWKRYCSNSMMVEQVYQDYLTIIGRLTEEYLECSSRAHRLSAAEEALLAENDSALECFEFEDIQIYWRALIIKLQSQTYFKQLINLIKWFPYGHREGFKKDLSKQPQHLLNYDEDRGIREMLSLVLDKGPATVRIDAEKAHSSVASEEGADEIDPLPPSPIPEEMGHHPIGAQESAAESGQSPRDDVETLTTGRSTSESLHADESAKRDYADPNDPAWKSSYITNLTVDNLPDTSTGSIRSPRSPILIKDQEEQDVKATDQTFKFSEHSPQPPGIYMAHLEGAGNPLLPTSATIQFAVASGGLVLSESYFGLPLHATDITSIRGHLAMFLEAYSIEFNVQTIRSAADEMELFGVINRNFSRIFLEQEEKRTFKTYDAPSAIAEKWGIETPNRAMKKPANWLQFIKLKPHRNAYLVESMTTLRCAGNVDEILRSLSAFFKINKPEHVQGALRNHAMLVKNPPIIHSASVVNHRQGMKISEIYRKIFSNPELYKDRVSSGARNNDRSKFELADAMQRLGLDDANNEMGDPSSIQGGYLSFLHLRHLKIRDFQRTCISILNYFRSIERTLTINDQGLSLSSRGVERVSPQNHRFGPEVNGNQGGTNNLNGHSYLFNTPRDYRIKESEFIQFADIENHDDFYYHKDDLIHVRDQIGCWIIYDCALEDFDNLENDLLLLSTHFIQKDRTMRSGSSMKRKQMENDVNKKEFNIASYAHREIDRFGVLYDVWMNECAFQEAKKELMDVYMEAYQHVCSRDSRRRLAQVMVDLMHQRPRIELSSNYFVLAYRYECAILRLKAAIMKHCLNTQIEQQREYIIKLGATDSEYGYPIPIFKNNLISSNTDKPALIPCYLLELQTSLSMAANLAEAMQQAVNLTFDFLPPTRIIDEMVLEKRFYEVLQKEIVNMEPPGFSYTQSLQKDLFASNFIEDAKQMSNLLQERYSSIQEANTRGDKSQRKAFLLNKLGHMFNVVTLRHRLITCLWETEVLAKIYLRMAIEMGYDEYHLFLRPVQFEAASYKESANDAKPPIYITSVQDDDSSVDKFIASALPLAIHELDETHVGKFSFKGKVNVAELCDERGVENLLIILKTQLTHKNALITALMLAFNSMPSFFNSFAMGRSRKGHTSERVGTSIAEYTGFLSSQMGPTPLSFERAFRLPNMSFHPEAFFSIQLEKSICRDRVMNVYAKKTQATAKSKSGSSNESEKLKRDLISQFCDDYSKRTQQTALRAQIIAIYASLLTILKKVPNICNEFFTIGTMFEKKGQDDDAEMAKSDPRELRKRVRRVLSMDGTRLYNLWFIPHFIEVLFVFRQLDDEEATRALRSMCRIAGALHDIVHYLVAFARLGINSSKISTEQRAQIYAMTSKTVKTMFHKLHPTTAMEYANQLAANALATGPAAEQLVAGSEDFLAQITEQPPASVTPQSFLMHNGQSLLIDQVVDEMSSFDGGPMSNLAKELREIQIQINLLPDPQSACQVIELLNARREHMFLILDVCLSSVLSETFLANGNENAYRELVTGSQYPLAEMSNQCKPSLEALEFPVPEPLEPFDEKARQVFPWLSFLNSSGPFAIQYPRLSSIEYNIRHCLAGLRPVDKPTVHGELLSMMLALEDVLENGDIPESAAGQPLPIENYENLHYLLGRRFRNKRKEIAPPPITAGNVIDAAGKDENETRIEDAGLSTAETAPILRTDASSSEEGKLSLIETPMAAYALIKKYLILRKRVELLKREWGKRRLGLEDISTSSDFKLFVQVYRTERLFPILRSLSIQYKQPEMYALGPYQESDVQISPKGIPEIVLLQRQLVKLIESFENYMIGDIRKALVRQIDLVIKERNREEGNLPLDLWKKPAMKESLTVPRPALVDEFLENLMCGAREDTKQKTITFDTNHLNEVIQNIAIGVMRMQREAYENYAMYYENLLKNQHLLLYSREREVSCLREQMKQMELEEDINVQFRMSEQAHNLLLEVTALRAKLSEINEQQSRLDAKIRDQVRREFSSAMRNLFALSFEQKARIDEYRNNLHIITLKRISEIRGETATEMERIKEKSGAMSSAEDDLTERNNRLSQEINDIHQKNIHLQQMITRLKTVNTWKENTLRSVFEKQIQAIEEERNKSKAQVNCIGMLSEQRSQNLTEEMDKMRVNLTAAHKELGELRSQLDKEMKDKLEKKNFAERQAATEKQIDNIKQMHIEKLHGDIAEKDTQIRDLSERLASHERTKYQALEKALRDIETLKKRLADERKLKKIAIHKVDDLLSQVYEYEIAQAFKQAPSHQASSEASPNLSESLSSKKGDSDKTGSIRLACRNYQSKAKGYEGLLKRIKVPYTPQHYLEHRRKMVMVPHLQQNLAHEILGEYPPATHKEIAETQALENKQEKRHSSK